MPRRLTALLVMALVLVGTIAPALACAAALTDRDCCPAGSTMPCSGEGSGANSNGVVAACCVSAPQTSSAWIGMSREQAEEAQDHSSPPDPIIAMAWIATLAPRPHASHLPTHTAVAITGDGVLTYLRTGRLRL